jgi:hypothetical protein
MDINAAGTLVLLETSVQLTPPRHVNRRISAFFAGC